MPQVNESSWTILTVKLSFLFLVLVLSLNFLPYSSFNCWAARKHPMNFLVLMM